MAVKRAVALRETGDFVEQEGRPGAMAVFSEHMGDRAHLGVPTRAIHADEFTHAVDLIDPAAQAAIPALHQFEACFTYLGHALSPSVPIFGFGLILGQRLSTSQA